LDPEVSSPPLPSPLSLPLPPLLSPCARPSWFPCARASLRGGAPLLPRGAAARPSPPRRGAPPSRPPARRRGGPPLPSPARRTRPRHGVWPPARRTRPQRGGPGPGAASRPLGAVPCPRRGPCPGAQRPGPGTTRVASFTPLTCSRVRKPTRAVIIFGFVVNFKLRKLASCVARFFARRICLISYPINVLRRALCRATIHFNFRLFNV
jgi:hypothetical protein